MKFLLEKSRSEIRKNSLLSATRPRQVISESFRKLVPEVSSLIPEYPSLRRGVQRIRQCSSFPYDIPSNAQELIIPEEYKVTFRNERFLLSDTNDDNCGRIIIYCTDQSKSI